MLLLQSKLLIFKNLRNFHVPYKRREPAYRSIQKIIRTEVTHEEAIVIESHDLIKVEQCKVKKLNMRTGLLYLQVM